MLGIIDHKDQNRQNLCLDTILHELCHTYDYGRKKKLLKQEFLLKKIAQIDAYVFDAAESAWSEYFANKYCTTTCSSQDMYPQYLETVVYNVVNDIKTAIRSYRNHGILDQLLRLCVQKIRFLFQCFGYAAGRLSANRMSLKQVAPNSVVALRSAGLLKVWLEIVRELDRLDEIRETWTSYEELKNLMSLVDDVFRVLGMHFSESNGVVRVDIPYTSDTMP